MPTIDERIQLFIAHADEIAKKAWENHVLPAPTHRAFYSSDKWVKIIRVDHYQDGTSRDSCIYAFVCRVNSSTKTLGVLTCGDIHKPASYNAPAKHARGNVFVDGFNKCAGPYGIVYLR